MGSVAVLIDVYSGIVRVESHQDSSIEACAHRTGCGILKRYGAILAACHRKIYFESAKVAKIPDISALTGKKEKTFKIMK